jgi:hypothetical protein
MDKKYESEIQLSEKMRIRFFSNFCDSNHCKINFERCFESSLLNYYGINKKIYITNEDDYTHAIILNTDMPLLNNNIPIKNVVGLAFEPINFLGLTDNFIEYAKKNISKYFIGDKINLPEPFIEHTAYMCHITPIKEVPVKNKLMSIMISQKTIAPGHKYRYDMVNAILNTNLPIDIYGKGCFNFTKDNADRRIKGEFLEKEPYEDYYFHICIENFQSNEYFSEKIINPLLYSSTPIYLGCHNIKKYFPNDVICLTGDVKNDIEMLSEILCNSMKYYKKPDLEEIKNSTNFFRNLDKIFE